MWRFTHDPKYRQWGWEAAQVNNVYKRLHCAPCSFWFEWLEQFVRTSAFLCILWTTREDVIRHLLDLLCSTEQVQYESLFSQTKRSSNSHCMCLHGQNISFSAVYSEKNSIPTQQFKLNQRNQYSTKASVNIQPCTLRLTCINMLSISKNIIGMAGAISLTFSTVLMHSFLVSWRSALQIWVISSLS